VHDVEARDADALRARQRALIQTGRNPGPINQSIPTFTFDNRLYGTDGGPFQGRSVASNYQMQLTVRYAF
jgi:hypothetical protein